MVQVGAWEELPFARAAKGRDAGERKKKQIHRTKRDGAEYLSA
jgi:hypothetical protein